jgi:hypothetical protein
MPLRNEKTHDRQEDGVATRELLLCSASYQEVG